MLSVKTAQTCIFGWDLSVKPGLNKKKTTTTMYTIKIPNKQFLMLFSC